MSPKLDALTQALQDEFQLTAVMAAEIECYVVLAENTAEVMDAFWAPLDTAWRAAGYPLLRIEKERGIHQYEVVTAVTTPAKLVDTLSAIRADVEAQGAAMGVVTNFAAKPFPDQPSSGLHLHLHLADAEGINSFHKTEDWTSDTLRFSIGGLLANLNGAMPIFFPTAEDYTRLDDTDHVPKIAGWGVNNRYCALRIPMDPDPYNKRIEHRVPCANADPLAAVEAVLEGVLKGLREQIEPPAQDYGKRAIAVS